MLFFHGKLTKRRDRNKAAGGKNDAGVIGDASDFDQTARRR
jgi:hypothetical protein